MICPRRRERGGDFGIVEDRVVHALLPLIRAYVRYTPWTWSKVTLWSRVVGGYFARHAHRFVARTRSGVRIAGDTQEFIELYLYFFSVLFSRQSLA